MLVHAQFLTTMKLYYRISPIYVSVNSNWVHPLGQTPGIHLKKLPGGSGFDFWKLSGGRQFDKGRDFVESSNYAKRHINVCSGGDLCSPFLTIFLRPVSRF